MPAKKTPTAAESSHTLASRLQLPPSRNPGYSVSAQGHLVQRREIRMDALSRQNVSCASPSRTIAAALL